MEKKKGTVTSLSSLFPAEVTQNASRRVQEAIAEQKQQLDQLNSFITDNTSLINLVNRLPDELHHDIMVPFGKAAFFPGRLIHTNEFMVLLGEGYYAERTSKQTAEILKRRGKALETQVESLKAAMQDLKAEASFFDATASEASEGLVEIREDLVEEDYSGQSTKIGIISSEKEPAPDDEEYARIDSIMAELEKEEEEQEKQEEAEISSGSDEDVPVQNELSSSISRMNVSQEVRHLQVKAPEKRPVAKAVSPHGNYPTARSSTENKSLELSEAKKEVKSAVTASNTAFTGSIIEHAHNIGTNSTEQGTGTIRPKPVSRFKMQRK